MKTNLFIFVFLIFYLFHLNSGTQDAVKKADELDYAGKYQEALDVLLNASKDSSTDLQIIFRIGTEAYESANLTGSKKEKLKYYDIGMGATKPFLDNPNLSKRDRVTITHWYMINYASKMKLLGIFGGRESLNIVPALFKAMDNSISIDPEFSGAYFFEAKLYSEVPYFLGGDKIKMAESFLKALSYAEEREKTLMLLDAAKGFIDRNWSAERKRREFKRAGLAKGDGTPVNLSDKEYVINMLSELKTRYEKNSGHSVREEKIYNEAVQLVNKIK
jgi:hypothetical protein